MTGTYHYTDNTISFHTEKTTSTYFVEFSSNLSKIALLFVCLFGFFLQWLYFVSLILNIYFINSCADLGLSLIHI